MEYIHCASWPLVQDREHSPSRDAAMPTTTAAKNAALEDCFGALTKGYRKTKIGIWYVDQNMRRIEQLIVALKEGERLD